MNWRRINWNPIVVALILSTPPTIMSIAAVSKVNAVQKDVEVVSDQATETHHLVNSRMTELLRITPELAAAEATAAEKKAEKARDDSEER